MKKVSTLHFLTKCSLDNKFNQIVQSVQIMDMYLEKGNLKITQQKVLLSIFAKDIKANDFPSSFWRY